MKKFKSSLAVLFMFLVSMPAFASIELIKEVEDLRNSIGLTDRQRPRLTLRLADLYFDLALDKAQTEAEQGILELPMKFRK